MKKYNVTFEVFRGNSYKDYKTITVEARTKKLATIRAMSKINQIDGYSDLYKNVFKVEEIE